MGPRLVAAAVNVCIRNERRTAFDPNSESRASPKQPFNNNDSS